MHSDKSLLYTSELSCSEAFRFPPQACAIDDSTPLRALLKGRRGLSFFLPKRTNRPLSAHGAGAGACVGACRGGKSFSRVTRRESYGRPRGPGEFCCMNVARTFEQPGSLEKGPYCCSLLCRCDFACFPFTPAVGPENKKNFLNGSSANSTAENFEEGRNFSHFL